MAENSVGKLVAVAGHVGKTLGHSDTMTDDILKIFPNFDGRLRENLTGKLSDDGVERTVSSIERKLSGDISSDAPIWSNSVHFSSFLDSVDQLIAVVREWTPLAEDKHISSCLHRAEDLLQRSMFRLRDEFRTLVQWVSGSTDRPDFSEEDDDVPVEDDDNCIHVAQQTTYSEVSGTIGDLHEIAKRMVAAGYAKECSHAYSACRRESLDESLYRLGLQWFSIDEVEKMQWAQLEDETEKWIKAINVALRILYPSERRLCDRVFSGFSLAAELSFVEVCRGSMIHLLNFARAMGMGSRWSPERLFKVLDVYETIRDLMPEFELIFSDRYCSSLRDEAVTIGQGLEDVIKGMFMELENLIGRDPAKPMVPGGGLHPINRYVVNYLLAACRSRHTLERVFEGAGSNLEYRKGDKKALSLAAQVAWIMELLETNLEAKSKSYRDPALWSVFMMNNGRYIVHKVKDSELGRLLGGHWIKKHAAKVRQYRVYYQRCSWSKVLSVLNLKVDNDSHLSSQTLRKKLELFNSYLEDICRIQSSWVIFDEQLKEELRISVSGSLSPAYRDFIERLQADWEQGDWDIRYNVDDVEARISELFQGTLSGRSRDKTQVSQ
jgi:hypothetical protein